MTNERKILAKNVKTYRKEHNLSQMEFAEDCGISDVSLCRIERQNSNVSLDTMQLLAARMDETVSELLQSPDLFTYCLIPTPICINDKDIVTYGIGIIKNHIMLDFILDISDDYNAVLSLMKLCDNGQAHPVHLKDIVENFLAE